MKKRKDKKEWKLVGRMKEIEKEWRKQEECDEEKE